MLVHLALQGETPWYPQLLTSHLSSQMLEICFVSWRIPCLLEFLEAVLLLDSGVILLISGEMTQEIAQMGER